ncbi:MAG: hypothetical protein EZS28_046677, partial [Streblomastix strix]
MSQVPKPVSKSVQIPHTTQSDGPKARSPQFGSIPMKKSPTPGEHNYNSTSTMLTDGDVGLANPEALCPSVCVILHRHIEDGHRLKQPIVMNIFSEKYHPLQLPNDPPLPRNYNIPTIEEIHFFLQLIVKKLEVYN